MSLRRFLADARAAALAIALFVVLPVFAFGALTVRETGQRLRAAERAELTDSAAAVAANEADILSRQVRRVRARWNGGIAGAIDATPAARSLESVRRALGADGVGVAFADAAGRVIASDPYPFGASAADMALPGPASDDVVRTSDFRRLGERTYYVLAVPVGDERSPAGTVLVGMDTRSLLRSLRTLMGVYREAFVVDGSGAALSVARYADRAADGEDDPADVECCGSAPSDAPGEPMMYGRAAVDGGAWHIVLGERVGNLDRELDSVVVTLRLLGVIGVVLLIAGALLVGSLFHRAILQRDRLREVQVAARIGGWHWDMRRRRFFADAVVLEALGLPTRGGGIPMEMLLHRIHDDDRARVQAEFVRGSRASGPFTFRCRAIDASGRAVVVEAGGRPRQDPRGRVTAIEGTAQDVTELMRAEEQRAQLLAQVDAIDEAVVGTTLDGTVTEWNAAAERLFGYERGEMLGRSIRLLRPLARRSDPDSMLHTVAEGVRMERREIDRVRKDGTAVYVAVCGTPVWNAGGDVVAATFTYRDTSEKRRLEAELAERVSHDALTGLPNRFLLQDRLEQALRAADRSGGSVAVLELDIDRFREVNEAIGPLGADALLVEAAARLQAEVRAVDTVARLGTDVFALCVPGAQETAAALVAARVRSALQQPFRIREHEIALEVSVGIAIGPAHGSDVQALLRHCDIALTAAKRSRAGYALYAPAEESDTPSRVIVLSELRQAIAQSELTLEYQPEVDVRTGETVRVEALLRWAHPQRGLLLPLAFIPLVEDTGLVGPLTRWVIAEAAQQCRSWQDAGIHMPIAVNLSARSVLDPDLADCVAASLLATGIEGKMLTLEITEGVLLSDATQALAVIARLRALGARIALDDFGTGYSSFAYLDRLPLDEMKVDRSFIAGLDDERTRAIVSTMIDLAHHLGFEVVAEGVERDELAAHLRELACDTLQGYAIGRPMSAAALERWLRAHPARIAA